MESPIEIVRHEGLLVFRLVGDLTSHELDILKRGIVANVRETGVYRVLLNLRDVDFVTSKDVGVLVQLLHFLRNEREGANVTEPELLAFSNLSQFVRDIMAMTKLETVFRIFETEEEAIRSLASEQDSVEGQIQ